MVATQSADPVERGGDDAGLSELGVGAGWVVERRVDGRVREGGEHREDDPLRPTPLGEIVVGDRDGGATSRIPARHHGIHHLSLIHI